MQAAGFAAFLNDNPSYVDHLPVDKPLRNDPHQLGRVPVRLSDDQEPLPAESPFWDLDNLLIMPHTAGMTAKLWDRHYTLFSENLRRYLSGQPLLGLVDKKAGY